MRTLPLQPLQPTDVLQVTACLHYCRNKLATTSADNGTTPFQATANGTAVDLDLLTAASKDKCALAIAYAC